MKTPGVAATEVATETLTAVGKPKRATNKKPASGGFFICKEKSILLFLPKGIEEALTMSQVSKLWESGSYGRASILLLIVAALCLLAIFSLVPLFVVEKIDATEYRFYGQLLLYTAIGAVTAAFFLIALASLKA